MIGDFNQMANDLDRQIAIEQERAGVSDTNHYAYPTFAKAAIQRRDNLFASAADLDAKLASARETLAEAFEELKKIELLGGARRRADEDRAGPRGRAQCRGGHASPRCELTAKRLNFVVELERALVKRAGDRPMPSFDIVSKTDLAEIDNALANMVREMSQRYDFKGSQSRIERKEAEITINADDELKLKQMHELLQGHLARRKIEPGVLDYKTVEKAAGQAVRQKALIRQGIDRELAKRIVKEVKDGKFKVQVTVQGDELRVSGKKRDDLQAVIQHVKGLSVELPLQYVNFRD